MDISCPWVTYSLVTLADFSVDEWFLWIPTGLGLSLALCPTIYVISKPGSLATKQLTESRQIISGKGFKLEISTLSLLVLSGVILALSGVGYKAYSAIEAVSKLKADNAMLQEEVQRAQTITVVMFLKLPAARDVRGMSNLRCSYRSGGPDYKAAQTTAGKGNQDVGCVIANVGRYDVLDVKLEQLDEGGSLKKLGSYENIRVLEPSFDLHE